MCRKAGTTQGGRAARHVWKFEASDQRIKSFRVVFGDIQFNAGSIKGKGPGQNPVDGEADGFGIIDHALEHQFDKGKKVLPEACEQRSARDLGKAAEVPEFFAEGKKENEQGVGRDGKDLLEDKGREEAVKGVKSFPAEGLVKSIIKDVGNKL